MNEIIRKIEAEQLKENAPEFHVGDTVKVYAKIKEGNRESCLLSTSCTSVVTTASAVCSC